jgi:hypothetical protein
VTFPNAGPDEPGLSRYGRGVSDTILRLYASDPDYRADPPTAARAKDAAKLMFPGADQIDVEVYSNVTLIDCGENLERIVCPRCGATIAVDWWGARMDELADDAWEQADVDAPTPSPCCGEPVTVRSLIYHWPMGFARFTIDVWNPSPWPEDNDPNKPATALGEAIGVRLRGLWAHY